MALFRSWFPWRFIVRRLARAHGFIDPLTIYARLQRFAQPSEVAEPVELLRAGAIFHARGIVNSRAIQHNLDWIWPYWVERQFDPADVSFLPRAFSLTHVNLTHRSWTAVGLPGREVLPIVDPRGLVTPFWDGWSLDVWMLDDKGQALLPSRSKDARQRQIQEKNTLAVETRTEAAGMTLVTDARLVATDKGDVCRLAAQGEAPGAAWLVIALRPCNPEGVSFIDHVRLADDRRSWLVDGADTVRFDQRVERHHASRYHSADVWVHLADRADERECLCPVGLVTAAAMFRVEPGAPRLVHVDVPVRQAATQMLPRRRWPFGARSILIRGNDATDRNKTTHTPADWQTALAGAAPLTIPNARCARLYQAALRTLVLCSPGEVYAGPYTYKRFWYRDAVFVGHALLLAGLTERVESIVRRFPEHQTRAGYYHSQEGEWDANGEVLWLSERFHRFTGQAPDLALWASLRDGADWIDAKRLPDRGGQPHEGLLPAGFSAEHLGPNDHYYWDNAWSVAGLDAAARLADSVGQADSAERFRKQSAELRAAIERSLARLPDVPGMPAIPAAPARRLDAGAIGSIAFSYPLQLLAPDDARMRGTVDFLLTQCFHEGGFFQDMIHSGVNAYLTLHVAQALLRAGDSRHVDLMLRVAELASPTGHWPEALHPHTGGGCMGDGHHAWAAAEWVAMLRNCFVREEGEALHLGTGIPGEWLEGGQTGTLAFGPAPTAFGPIRVELEPLDQAADRCRVRWQANWHDAAPRLVIAPPGHEPGCVEVADGSREGEIVTHRSTP